MVHHIDAVVYPITHVHIPMPRLPKQRLITGAAPAVSVASGLAFSQIFSAGINAAIGRWESFTSPGICDHVEVLLPEHDRSAYDRIEPMATGDCQERWHLLAAY
jgi:hypothetical protein